MNKKTNLDESEKELLAFLKRYKSNEALSRENIDKITYLDLSGMGIEKLPDSIGNLINLQELDLSNNELTNLPDSIGNLINLQELDLLDNQLTSLPDSIGNLINLQELDLSGNELTNLPDSIGSLANLQVLNLSGDHLTSLPDRIGSLANLRNLNLFANQLTSLPDNIGSLVNLHTLYLTRNQLTSLPDRIGSLANLQVLNLSENQLTSLPNSIGSLASLQELYLLDNQLTSLPNSIGSLASLQELYLLDNQLTSLPDSMENLANLQELDLSANQLTSLPDSLGQLKKLSMLDLSYCHILSLRPVLSLHFVVLFDRTNDRKSGKTLIYCNGLQVDDLPDEILRQGEQAIREHYEQINKEKNIIQEEMLYEAKIVVVGNGDSGKTSLVKTLLGLEFDPEEKKTAGMKKYEFNMQIGGHDWLFRIFDFGGQTLYRATQTMFMSPGCLYIIVLDGRSEDLPDVWLNYIRSLAKEAPVLLVINKSDENPRADINRDVYLKRYPFIHGEILKFSCKKRSPELTGALRTEIEKIVSSDKFNRHWPVAWNNVKSSLMDRLAQSSTYLDKKTFDEICLQHGVTEPKTREIIRVACHNLGAVYSYCGDGICIFMKPEDVIAGANRLLNIPLEDSSGGYVTTETYYEKMYEEQDGVSFDHTSAECILNVLKECGIICYVEESKKLLVASLLPVQPPQNVLPEYKTGWEEFIVRYRFLPLALILKFIVQNQNNGVISCWKHGMYWQEGDAQIIMEQEENQLHFYMKGSERALCGVRDKLYCRLEELHRKINISNTEFLIVVKKEAGTAHYSYKDLLILEEMGVEEFPLPACRTVERVGDYVRFFSGGKKDFVHRKDRAGGDTYIQIQKAGQVVAKQEIAGDLNIGDTSFVEELISELRKTVEQESRLKEAFRGDLLQKLEEMRCELNKKPEKKTLEKWKDRLALGGNLASLGLAIGSIISNYIMLFQY